jgi:hypothetical protein
MNPEVEFLKKVESFLDQQFNEYSKNRIIGYLNEYKETIPPVIIRKTIEKEKIIEKRPIRLSKSFAKDDDIMEEAIKFCNENNIELKLFLRSKYIKSTCEMSSARKKFCRYMYEAYLCNNTQLARFFDVDNSTVSFYLYGKKSIKKI